jgi:hypothetical protein
MLYDPNWNKPTTDTKKKPGVFTLDGLIAWLETKDPNEKYRYLSIHRCLLAQYFHAKGFRFVSVGPNSMDGLRYGFIPYIKELPPHFDNIAVSCCTFGSALAVAKNIRGDHNAL